MLNNLSKNHYLLLVTFLSLESPKLPTNPKIAPGIPRIANPNEAKMPETPNLIFLNLALN